MPKSRNITWSHSLVTRQARQERYKHTGAILWFTGLSGSGKSTLAKAVEQTLFERGCQTYILDGDNVRFGLNRDLGFSPDDRTENIRRIGAVARLFTQAGIVNLTAFISPYRQDRDMNREIQAEGDFIEVFVNSPLAVCEERDPKGLYARARAGEIKNFTGIAETAPYEPPDAPELVLDTHLETPDESADHVIAHLKQQGYLDGVDV